MMEPSVLAGFAGAGLVLAGLLVWGLRCRAALRAAQGTVAAQQARMVEDRHRIATLEERLTRLPEVQEHLAVSQREQHRQAADLAALRQEYADLQRHQAEKIRLLTDARDQLALQFKAVAGDLLAQTGERLGQQQQERLDHLLRPLANRIERFEQQVARAYDQEGRERVGLLAEIRRLAEQGDRLGQEATSLARALQGQAKTRGDWGEVILDRLLEEAGLRRGSDYRVQPSRVDAQGRRFQPDVVVELPEDRCLIVDAKVNLVAWMAVSGAETEAERNRALDELATAVRRHVRDLGQKAYQTLPDQRTVDFVLLFVPIEPAFSACMGHDPALYREALDRHVVLVGPSTLLATMRTVAMTWRHDRQERNAQAIAEEAGRMYDQLVLYTDSLEEVGQRLDQAQRAHDLAWRRLAGGRGNLLRRAELVREMGAKAARRLGARAAALVESGSPAPSCDAAAEATPQSASAPVAEPRPVPPDV